MRPGKIFILFIIYSMLVTDRISAQKLKVNSISWSKIAELPSLNEEKQLGVAGPFAGVSNGALLIAGGSNFPGAKPWDGGQKVNKDDIYVVEKLSSGKFKWVISQNPHLPQKLAYGSSVSTDKGIVCIGGETDVVSCSNTAFIMQWDVDKKCVNFRQLTPLPVKLVNCCAACIHDVIYVFGGESNGVPVNSSFKLDLNNEHAGWKSLPPLPIAMSHSVAVAQSNGHYPCIYVIGGRSATISGISTLHGNTFCFDPIQQKWLQLSNISDGKTATNMAAATAVAAGNDQIILIGGDKGNIFHKIESYNAAIDKTSNEKQRQALQAEKLQLVTHHPGFSRDVYLYNTLTDKWQRFGELPFYGQVTTTAVKWGNEIFIPGGEIMPGTRTSAITLGVINK